MRVMDLRDLCREREAQSRAVLLARTGLVHHVERLRDAAQLRFWNAAPVIDDGNAVAPAGRHAVKPDGRRAGFERVVEQIHQQRLEQVVFHPHPSGRGIALDGDAALLRRRKDGRPHVVQKLLRVHLLENEIPPVEIQQVHQLERQRLEPHGLVEDVPRPLPHLLRAKLLLIDGVGVADDGGHRRFQLVREIRRERLLALGGLLQLTDLLLDGVRHLIEGSGKLAQLVAALHVGADLIISRRDGPARPLQRRDRPRQPPRQQERSQHSEGDDGKIDARTGGADLVGLPEHVADILRGRQHESGPALRKAALHLKIGHAEAVGDDAVGHEALLRQRRSDIRRQIGVVDLASVSGKIQKSAAAEQRRRLFSDDRQLRRRDAAILRRGEDRRLNGVFHKLVLRKGLGFLAREGVFQTERDGRAFHGGHGQRQDQQDAEKQLVKILHRRTSNR